MNSDYIILWIWTFISLIWFYFYFRDIFRGNTKPHMFTWLIWSVMSYIGFGIQVTNGWWAWSFIMLLFAVLPTIVFFLTLKSADKNIVNSDYLSLIWAAIALILWLMFEQALLSVCILLLIDFMAYLPTARKSYMKPFEESMLLYSCVNAGYIASILTFTELVPENYLYPSGLFIYNILLISFVLIRRKQLSK